MLNWSEGLLPCGGLSILGPDNAAFPVCNIPLGGIEHVYFKQIAIALCLLSIITLEVLRTKQRLAQYDTVCMEYVGNKSTARRSLGDLLNLPYTSRARHR